MTYIGVTDATPPRLGRTENSVSPGDAENAADIAIQGGDGGTGADQNDAGAAPDRVSGGDGASDADNGAADGPG